VHVEYNHDSMLCGASVNHGSLANADVGRFLANEKIASRSMVHSKAERGSVPWYVCIGLAAREAMKVPMVSNPV
jgi:hypothetical protein